MASFLQEEGGVDRTGGDEAHHRERDIHRAETVPHPEKLLEHRRPPCGRGRCSSRLAHADHGLPLRPGARRLASRRRPASSADAVGPSLLSASTQRATPSAGRSRYCGSPLPARRSTTTSSVRRTPFGKRFSRYATHSPISKRWPAMRLLSCCDAAPLFAANPFQMSTAAARMRVRRNCRRENQNLISSYTGARTKPSLFSLITANFFAVVGKTATMPVHAGGKPM